MPARTTKLYNVQVQWTLFIVSILRKTRKKQDVHSYTLLCNTTLIEQDLQNGIKKLLFELINKCAVRFYVFWSFWIDCVKTRLTYDKTPPNSKQKQLVCYKNSWQNISRSPTKLENCGKTFLDRPPSADQAQQMHCLPPQFEVENAKWSFDENQWKDSKKMLNVHPFVKLFGQVPQSEFQIPGSIVLRHWPVTRCLPECLCAYKCPPLCI